MNGTERLYRALAELSVPFQLTSYEISPETELPPLPFGVYFPVDWEALWADGELYSLDTGYQIDLMTRNLDEELYSKLEAALDRNDFYWERKDCRRYAQQRFCRMTWEVW